MLFRSPPHGAFRGFGAPQSIFALERHMDRVAKTIGLAPEEFRRRNFIKEGETTATNQTIREKVDLEGLLTRAFDLSSYHAKRERFARENGGEPSLTVGLAPRQLSDVAPRGTSPTAREGSNGKAPRIKKGIGFASFMHGAGFTGSGEVFLQSVVGDRKSVV